MGGGVGGQWGQAVGVVDGWGLLPVVGNGLTWVCFRIIWKSLENFGKLWKSLEIFGNLWNSLENFGNLCKALENFGNP